MGSAHLCDLHASKQAQDVGGAALAHARLRERCGCRSGSQAQRLLDGEPARQRQGQPGHHGVARTLGAGRFTTFRTVTLPLSLRHLFNGAILAWGRAIGEFAAVVMIAYYPFIISTLIYYSFTTDGIRASRSIAFTVILISFGVFYLLRRMTRHLGRYDDRV